MGLKVRGSLSYQARVPLITEPSWQPEYELWAKDTQGALALETEAVPG